MTMSSPDDGPTGLPRVNLPLPAEAEYGVHFSIFGSELLLTGHVPSYEAKCRIEAAARNSGYRIQNCLKVTPGIDHAPWLSPAQQ